jgi:hypothetical protein
MSLLQMPLIKSVIYILHQLYPIKYNKKKYGGNSIKPSTLLRHHDNDNKKYNHDIHGEWGLFIYID